MRWHRSWKAGSAARPGGRPGGGWRAEWRPRAAGWWGSDRPDRRASPASGRRPKRADRRPAGAASAEAGAGGTTRACCWTCSRRRRNLRRKAAGRASVFLANWTPGRTARLARRAAAAVGFHAMAAAKRCSKSWRWVRTAPALTLSRAAADASGQSSKKSRRQSRRSFCSKASTSFQRAASRPEGGEGRPAAAGRGC